MYSFLFLEHIREFFEHDGILGSESQFITQRIRDAAPFLNAHVLSALRMGECTARDLCTVRQGLLSDVTRTAERAKLDRHALHIRWHRIEQCVYVTAPYVGLPVQLICVSRIEGRIKQ